MEWRYTNLVIIYLFVIIGRTLYENYCAMVDILLEKKFNKQDLDVFLLGPVQFI